MSDTTAPGQPEKALAEQKLFVEEWRLFNNPLAVCIILSFFRGRISEHDQL